MTTKQIDGLTARTTPVSTDQVAVDTSGAVSYKVSLANLAKGLQVPSDTVASSATPSINVDTTRFFTITALATAITSMTSGLSGTPVAGQPLVIRIKDNGTARAITWGASFATRIATLPTTTVLGKYLYVAFQYNTIASVWDCLFAASEA